MCLVLLVDIVVFEQVDVEVFDVIYFIGGYGVMWDFFDDVGLQYLICEIYQCGGIVLLVCYGYCGLFNICLDDGCLLVVGCCFIGYFWIEEVFVGVVCKVLYNVEEEMK